MIILKQHSSHHVAHLYEHLFRMAIDEYFCTNNLDIFIDYNVYSRTTRGIAYISLDLLTPAAKALENDISHLSVSLDYASLHFSILQIATEKEMNIGIVGENGKPNYEAVKEELTILEKKEWQEIDLFDSTAVSETKLSDGALFLPQEVEKFETNKLNISISLDQSLVDEQKELLPLFLMVAMTMKLNIHRDLSHELACYFIDFESFFKGEKVSISDTYRIATLSVMSFENVTHVTKAAVEYLIDNESFTRLADKLSSASYKDISNNIPSPLYIYEMTGVFIGTKDWERIATQENCERILSSSTITIEMNNQQEVFGVKAILNDTES